MLGALPGIIGSAQAMETIKLILGVGTTLAGRLLIFDSLEMTWREVTLRRNPACPVCADTPTQTELIDYEVFCGVKEDPSVEGSQSESSAGWQELTPSDLSHKLAGEDAPFLVDVRESWEWAVGSLADLGARLIPLSELKIRVGEIPRERPIVVYCRSGQRSRTAAEQLLEAGFADVSSLTGGLRAWAEKVNPQVRVV